MIKLKENYLPASIPCIPTSFYVGVELIRNKIINKKHFSVCAIIIPTSVSVGAELIRNTVKINYFSSSTLCFPTGFLWQLNWQQMQSKQIIFQVAFFYITAGVSEFWDINTRVLLHIPPVWGHGFVIAINCWSRWTCAVDIIQKFIPLTMYIELKFHSL